MSTEDYVEQFPRDLVYYFLSSNNKLQIADLGFKILIEDEFQFSDWHVHAAIIGESNIVLFKKNNQYYVEILACTELKHTCGAGMLISHDMKSFDQLQDSIISFKSVDLEAKIAINLENFQASDSIKLQKNKNDLIFMEYTFPSANETESPAYTRLKIYLSQANNSLMIKTQHDYPNCQASVFSLSQFVFT